jgi:hypothetical protein
VTIYDKGPASGRETYGEWQTRTGDIYSPKIANDEPLRLECEHFPAPRRRRGRPARGGARRRCGRAGARAAAGLAGADARLSYQWPRRRLRCRLRGRAGLPVRPA